MKIAIQRCFKKPGLIIRAKTYYLELNGKGLYIIALGNATQMPVARTGLQQMVADAAVNYFDAKYEVQIAANEGRIRNGELDTLATEKYSYFLAKDQVGIFKTEQSGPDAIKIQIKGGKANITLYAHIAYSDKIREMNSMLGKS